jgi:rhamnosyltransferase
MPDVAGEACADVSAVVVTYRPDIARIRELIAVLRAQVGRIVIVDNGSPAETVLALAGDAGADSAVELLRNDENLGIGAAQNLGMARALDVPDCRYLLLCDDDSMPAPAMVASLRAALMTEASAGASAGASARASAPLAAVGPWCVDERSGEDAVLIVDDGRGPRRWRPPASAGAAPTEASGAASAELIDVGFLIASGTLIPAATLRQLRGMRGSYFIDHVDTEWCLRARAAGFRLAVVPQARLRHRLGDSVRKVWFLGARQVAWHAPLRDYYTLRNTLLLLRDVALPGAWRRYLIGTLVKYAAYFLLLGDRRASRLRHMLLGFTHGLRGQSGRLRENSSTCDPIAAAALDPSFRSPVSGKTFPDGMAG